MNLEASNFSRKGGATKADADKAIKFKLCCLHSSQSHAYSYHTASADARSSPTHSSTANFSVQITRKPVPSGQHLKRAPTPPGATDRLPIAAQNHRRPLAAAAERDATKVKASHNMVPIAKSGRGKQIIIGYRFIADPNHLSISKPAARLIFTVQHHLV